MKRFLLTALVVGLIAGTAGAGRALAQGATFGLGGGLTQPVSDYNTADKAGWHALGKVDFAIPASPLGVRVDALFGQTSHKDFNGTAVDGHTQLLGGVASLVWHIPTQAPMVKPYVLAGLGMYNAKFTVPSASVDTSQTKVAFGGGAGVSFGLGPTTHLFVEGRYLSIQTSGTKEPFIPITAGLSFGSK